MINVAQFRDLIIEATLDEIGMYSGSAVELLLGTAIQESNLTYLDQRDGDDIPYDDAIGFYQVERFTHDSLWDNWLHYRKETTRRVLRVCGLSERPDASVMAWNLKYATAMCRIKYRTIRQALPETGDTKGQARYWKDFYNSSGGAGKVDEYINNWNAVFS